MREKKNYPDNMVRVYDDGGVDKGGLIDRYTVCYRAYTAGPDYARFRVWSYLGMSALPFHPQGVGQHGESTTGPIDRPSHKHLGKRISFFELPEDCQLAVLQDLHEADSIKD